jgi:hypothetical protein
MYQNSTIIIKKEKVNDNTPTRINKGVLKGCPFLPVLFNIYTDKVSTIKQNILMKALI